jgi:hypothetical protein
MSSPHPPVARVRTATRAGADRPNQDRIFITGNAIIVLDGASHPVPTAHDGGWLADTLGARLRDQLTTQPDTELADAVADAISTVAVTYHLVPGASPSTTVAIVRWTDTRIDAYVLGDSPIIALTHQQQILEVHDNRLATVARAERQALDQGEGHFGFDRTTRWHALVDAQTRRRNRPNGYWIAEADPRAATQAIRASWQRDRIATVLAMTDGIANGVTRYGIPADWTTAITIAREDPDHLVTVVHNAEHLDPDGARWHRTKRHDDKAAALIDFA